MIGVNCFVVKEGEKGPDPFAIDPLIEPAQVERLRTMRRSRDEVAVRMSLERLESVAREGGSVIEPTIGAVRVYATVGEISETLRGVFGSYHPDAVI
jgi:methylmalonyl-CoA mutase N-terminal domain/subunit